MAGNRLAASWTEAWPRVRAYVLGAALVAAATAIGLAVYPTLSTTSLVMLYLMAVVAAAVYLGHGPALTVAVAGVGALDYLFVQPRFTFVVGMAEDLSALAGLLVVGMVISTLTNRLRREAEAARQREREAVQLYEFSRALASATDLEGVLQTVVDHAASALTGEAALLLLKDGTLDLRAATPGMHMVPPEVELARAVYADSFTANPRLPFFPSAGMDFLPLAGSKGPAGVLTIRPALPARPIGAEYRRLAESLSAQAALALERAQLGEEARRAQMLEAAERLQAALLNSISHDLRTPLVSITGALTALRDDYAQVDQEALRGLVSDACVEADRLNRLVGHLLDMTRIEARAMHLTLEPCDVQDAVGSALEQSAERLAGREVRTDLPPGLPLVTMDFVLIVQVLVNLIENAVKYSAAASPIEISAAIEGEMLRLEVADRGVGIPAGDLARIFDKFYRVQRPDVVTGSGLGLAICRGIVEAHSGDIAAANRPGGGTVISVTLPLTLDATRIAEAGA